MNEKAAEGNCKKRLLLSSRFPVGPAAAAAAAYIYPSGLHRIIQVLVTGGGGVVGSEKSIGVGSGKGSGNTTAAFRIHLI